MTVTESLNSVSTVICGVIEEANQLIALGSHDPNHVLKGVEIDFCKIAPIFY